MLLGFLLIGPAPFIKDLLLTTGLIKCLTGILGAGYAMVMVSTFGRSQAAAKRHGYHADLDTYMFISSKFNLARLLHKGSSINNITILWVGIKVYVKYSAKALVLKKCKRFEIVRRGLRVSFHVIFKYLQL